jgi:hypothetical protein
MTDHSDEIETPEQAARKRAIELCRLVHIADDQFVEQLGGTGMEDFLDGVEWAKNNPGALVNWRRNE